MSKPKLILDTNIATRLADKKRSPEQQRVLDKIRSDFDVAISPYAVVELMNGSIGALSLDHFNNDKRGMQILSGRGTGAVLSSSGHFALGCLLNREIESVHPEGPAFEYWIQVFLGASDPHSLFSGTVSLPGDKAHTHGISKQLVIERKEQNEEAVRDVVALAKEKKHPFPQPLEWVSGVGTGYSLALTRPELERLADSLSAAYHFVRRIYDDAFADPSYNVRPGDFVDSHHLWYLCDPSFHLLTADTKIKPRCLESAQSSRIIEFRDFLA